MIANPLNAPTNTIPVLFAGVPEGTTIYKFDGTPYSVNVLDIGEWGLLRLKLWFQERVLSFGTRALRISL